MVISVALSCLRIILSGVHFTHTRAPYMCCVQLSSSYVKRSCQVVLTQLCVVSTYKGCSLSQGCLHLAVTTHIHVHSVQVSSIQGLLSKRGFICKIVSLPPRGTYQHQNYMYLVVFGCVLSRAAVFNRLSCDLFNTCFPLTPSSLLSCFLVVTEQGSWSVSN